MSAVRYEVADGVATITLASPETRNVLNAESLPPLARAPRERGGRRRRARRGRSPARAARSAPAPTSRVRAPTRRASPAAGRGRSWRVLEAMLDHPKPIVAPGAGPRRRRRQRPGRRGRPRGRGRDGEVRVQRGARRRRARGHLGRVPGAHDPDARARAHAHRRAGLARSASSRRGCVTAVADADGFDAVVVVVRRPAAASAGRRRSPGPRSCCAACRRCRATRRSRGPREVSAAHFSSDEAREGMTAFFERRRPAWAPPERAPRGAGGRSGTRRRVTRLPARASVLLRTGVAAPQDLRGTGRRSTGDAGTTSVPVGTAFRWTDHSRGVVRAAPSGGGR